MWLYTGVVIICFAIYCAYFALVKANSMLAGVAGFMIIGGLYIVVNEIKDRRR